MNVKRIPIFVEWVDSAGSNGWQNPDDLHDDLMVCSTLGWLVKESKDGITVALNGVFDGSSRSPFGEFITIPKCAIKKRRKVKA